MIAALRALPVIVALAGGVSADVAASNTASTWRFIRIGPK